MKKIEFGYSNSLNPTGSYEGIGINSQLMLSDADYYGAIGFKENNYIVAKVVEDKHNRFPQLLGKFIVRKALCDLYPDGSCILMLNQREDNITQQIEYLLNQEHIKQSIKSPEDIFEAFNSSVYRAPKSFALAEMFGDKILATSITSEAFDTKNEAIKSCRDSFSSLQMQLTNGYTK